MEIKVKMKIYGNDSARKGGWVMCDVGNSDGSWFALTATWRKKKIRQTQAGGGGNDLDGLQGIDEG